TFEGQGVSPLPWKKAASVSGCWQGLTTGLSHAKKLLLGVWFAPPSNGPGGVNIQLIQDGRKIMALASNSRCLNFIAVNNLVTLLATVMEFKAVKVANVSLPRS
uniref:Uncharacterized protein n=1 Tax=Strix occidentalis caurina TaxID=311401 RepID=A0A8D0KX97_STROC